MHSVALSSATDFAGWRAAARRYAREGVAPEHIDWCVAGDASGSLFASPENNDIDLRTDSPSESLRVPKAFLDLAALVTLHRDPARFALLYRLLWRLRAEPQLLNVTVDADVARASAMEKSVRRDMHKMKAFVRFREAPFTDPSQLIAWFEPEHHIVEAVAPFFMRRFTSQRWSILTPERSVHWDLQDLTFGPGAHRSEAPAEDAAEGLWLSYYASIFNPARLKVHTMQGHMPKRYWRNLPEAALIPELVANATQRTEHMLHKAPAEPKRARRVARPTATPVEIVDTDLESLRTAVQACRDCPLWRNATQAVFGEGRERAKIVFVGEQPGDQEDLAGQPFVGPAGKMLDRALVEAGVNRKLTYVTNAVKHFKFEPRGKRRIHKKPNELEIAACNQWLQRELSVIKPSLVVALGATGARAVFGRATAIEKNRGHVIPGVEVAHVHTCDVLVTVHPSFLLRVPPEDKPAAYKRFVEDLKLAGEYAGR
jgi:probable DNA metabolism protein